MGVLEFTLPFKSLGLVLLLFFQFKVCSQRLHLFTKKMQ